MSRAMSCCCHGEDLSRINTGVIFVKSSRESAVAGCSELLDSLQLLADNPIFRTDENAVQLNQFTMFPVATAHTISGCFRRHCYYLRQLLLLLLTMTTMMPLL
jgi:hypothetical protein